MGMWVVESGGTRLQHGSALAEMQQPSNFESPGTCTPPPCPSTWIRPFTCVHYLMQRQMADGSAVLHLAQALVCQVALLALAMRGLVMTPASCAPAWRIACGSTEMSSLPCRRWLLHGQSCKHCWSPGSVSQRVMVPPQALQALAPQQPLAQWCH